MASTVWILSAVTNGTLVLGDRDTYPVPATTSSRKLPDTFRLLPDAERPAQNLERKRFPVEPVWLGSGSSASWAARGADSLAVS